MSWRQPWCNILAISYPPWWLIICLTHRSLVLRKKWPEIATCVIRFSRSSKSFERGRISVESSSMFQSQVSTTSRLIVQSWTMVAEASRDVQDAKDVHGVLLRSRPPTKQLTSQEVGQDLRSGIPFQNTLDRPSESPTHVAPLFNFSRREVYSKGNQTKNLWFCYGATCEWFCQ